MNTNLSIRVMLLVACMGSPLTRAAGENGQHLFILTGQSNMRGSLPGTFADAVAQVFGKDNVIVVTVARPSLPIKRWYKAWTPPEGATDPDPQLNGTMYADLLKSVQRAIQGKSIRTTTLVWMQGEEDARVGWGSVYEKSFNGVLEQFKHDLGVQKINFVLGRINDAWLPEAGIKDGLVVRAAQVKLGEASPNAAWIDTDDLNTGVNPWGGYSYEDGHFPPPGYRVMGQRFARKACLLIDPNLKLDERVFKEVFFDSSDDVKTHTAIGKQVRGAFLPDDAGAVARIVDGRYARGDASDPAWVTIPPQAAAVELIVDLGEATVIDSIAINLLVSPPTSAFPKKMIFSISEDGHTYRVTSGRHSTVTPPRGRDAQPKAGTTQTALAVVEQGNAKARYMKIEITTSDKPVLVDEVIVNPQP
jgi:hypothetical protein